MGMQFPPEFLGYPKIGFTNKIDSMKRNILLALALFVCLSASAQLRVKKPWSDSMVLQGSCEAVVRGWAEPGAAVTVIPSWNGHKYKATAASDGLFELTVATPEPGYTKHSLLVTSGRERLEIKDILVGEVWLAAGQSNMEMPLGGFSCCPVENALDELTGPSKADRIRYFTVPKERDFNERNEVGGEWKGFDASTGWDMSATAYYFAKNLSATLDVPIGIVVCAYGGSKVESWIPKEICDGYGDIGTSKKDIEALEYDFYSPYMMYNAMLKPVGGYTVKGMLWYQGCSNVGHDAEYADRLEDMVSSWRKLWNGAELPFYIVQIAPYDYGSPEDGRQNGALLRDAQRIASKRISNAALVCTNDLAYDYERGQIHPCQKSKIGERLALLALHRDYGYDRLPCYSPEVEKAWLSDGRIFLRATNLDRGPGNMYGIKGLYVISADGSRHPAERVDYDWVNGNVEVICKAAVNPVKVSFCWGDFVPGNLQTTAGLPFVPFEFDLSPAGM